LKWRGAIDSVWGEICGEDLTEEEQIAGERSIGERGDTANAHGLEMEKKVIIWIMRGGGNAAHTYLVNDKA
jgi:hypothetical protein